MDGTLTDTEYEATDGALQNVGGSADPQLHTPTGVVYRDFPFPFFRVRVLRQRCTAIRHRQYHANVDEHGVCSGYRRF